MSLQKPIVPVARQWQHVFSWMRKQIPSAATATQTVKDQLGMTTYKDVRLDDAYPGVPAAVPTEYGPVTTTQTKLSNGVSVVTRPNHLSTANIGITLLAGSRYMDHQTSGAPHFLEYAAMGLGTTNRSPLEMSHSVNNAGGNVTLGSFRDFMLYQMECFPQDASFAVDVISDLVRNVNLRVFDLPPLHKEYLYQRGDDLKNPDIQIPELLHQTAYRGNTLGLSAWCDEHTIKNMSPELLSEFMATFVRPSRIVVAGVGVQHQALEEAAQRFFGDLEEPVTPVPAQKATYTGGELRVKHSFDDENVHICLGYETENWHSKDLMAMCVLNMAMGGGGSFSAGGPGKGMYTRLYMDSLAQNPWIQHISTCHSLFDDTGIFSYYGVTDVENSGLLAQELVKQSKSMVLHPPDKKEIERAKVSLATNICFEFENQPVAFEDLARQVSVYSKHRSPEEWRDQIMAVTPEDVVRVTEKMLTSRPTVLAMGPDLTRVPELGDVCDMVKQIEAGSGSASGN